MCRRRNRFLKHMTKIQSHNLYTKEKLQISYDCGETFVDTEPLETRKDELKYWDYYLCGGLSGNGNLVGEFVGDSESGVPKSTIVTYNGYSSSTYGSNINCNCGNFCCKTFLLNSYDAENPILFNKNFSDDIYSLDFFCRSYIRDDAEVPRCYIKKITKFPNTDKCFIMRGAFYQHNYPSQKPYSAIEDLSGIESESFNTSNVYTMNGMFGGIRGLASLDLSNFDTSKVMDMNCMFNFTKLPNNFNVSTFDTSHVMDMGNMFGDCDGLETLDLTNFETYRCSNFRDFVSEAKIKKLIIPNFTIGYGSNTQNMFHCETLEEIDMKNVIIPETLSSTIFKYATSLKKIDLSNSDSESVNIIKDRLEYVNIPLENVTIIEPTEQWTRVEYVSGDSNTYICEDGVLYSKLIKEDGSVRKGYSISIMSDECGNGLSVPLTLPYDGFDDKFYYGITIEEYNDNLTEIVAGKEVRLLEILGVENGHLFIQYNLNDEKVCDIPNNYIAKWDYCPNNLEGEIKYLFSNLKKLYTLDCIKKIDTSKVTDLTFAFSGTTAQTEEMKTLDLSSWNVENVNDFTALVWGSNFETLNLSNWNPKEDAKFTSTNYSFLGGGKLKKVIVCNANQILKDAAVASSWTRFKDDKFYVYDCGDVILNPDLYQFNEVKFNKLDSETYICDDFNLYKAEIKQVSYDNGLNWENVEPLEKQKGELIETKSILCNYTPTENENVFKGTLVGASHNITLVINGEDVNVLNNGKYFQKVFDGEITSFQFKRDSNTSPVYGIKTIDEMPPFNIEDASYLFNNIYDLTSLKVNRCETPITNASYCFQEMPYLETLDLSGWEFSDDCNFYYAFNGTSTIRKIICSQHTKDLLTALPNRDLDDTFVTYEIV